MRRRKGTHEAILAGRAQRVHEHRRAQLLGGGEERLEARIADRRSVDMAGDFHAGELQGPHDVVELVERSLGVLQWDCSQADEALRGARDHRGDLVVQIPNEHLGVLRRQPVRQELRHRESACRATRIPFMSSMRRGRLQQPSDTVR
jgi:hypothetical protein